MKTFTRRKSTTDAAQFLWFSDQRAEAKKLNDLIYWEVHLCISSCEPEKFAWKQNRGRVLAEWTTSRPGTRPSYWWKFDAPRAPKETFPQCHYPDEGGFAEPRRLLSGAGRPEWEAHDFWHLRFGFGIPLEWEGFDESDPPVFEPEASYLERHGLLTADERKRADFAPVTVTNFGIFDLDDEIVY